MLKRFLLLMAVYFFVTYAISQPTITSFSPASGPTGSTVVINGYNFNTGTEGNIVFFGAVKATVTAASASAITVIVPPGANYKPLTVTTNGLTAYAAKPFFPTFEGGGTSINVFSFDTALNELTDLHPNDIAISDLDGDGKPDIATPNNYSIAGQPASFSALRNTTTGSKLSFAPKLDFSNGAVTYAIAAGDLDGDGKPDIVVSSIAEQTISVFRNTSNPGIISFSAKKDYPTGSVYSIIIQDLNGDGKPDIGVSNYLSNSITIFKNESNPGNISFSLAENIITGLAPKSLVTNDINGDGKPDLAVVNQQDNTVSVFLNLGASGSFVFSQKYDYTISGTPVSMASGDLDGDGKAEMIVTGGSSGHPILTVFKNTSSNGLLSFAAKKEYGSLLFSIPWNVTIGDLNGDAKIDLIFTANGSTVLAILNTSTPDALSFANPTSLNAGYSAFNAVIGDLNADSLPDITTAMFTSENVSVYRNTLFEPHILYFSPLSAEKGNTVTIYGGGFTGATAVKFGGVPAASFAVIDQGTINAVVGSGNSGDVSVTNAHGSASHPDFVFIGPPVISSFNPVQAAYNDTVVITGNNFTNVKTVSFGGTKVSFNVMSPNVIRAMITTGASGDVIVTTEFASDTLPGFTYLPVPVINAFTPNQGGRGTVVTITGINFTGITAVTFGGVPADSFTVVSPDTLTASPGNGATGSVSVNNINGAGTKPGFIFLPAPAITSFTPSSGINGSLVTITGNNLADVFRVEVGGQRYDQNEFAVVSPNMIQLTIDDRVQSGNITVTSQGGSGTIGGFIFYHPAYVTGISPAIANTGMEIMITGSFFEGVSQVTLGGVPVASLTVVSPSVIRAIVGAGASGKVIITNPAVTPFPNIDFVFKDNPLISGYGPQSGPPGTLITIKGGGFNATATANIVTIGGITAIVKSATANSIVAQVPANAAYTGISVTNTANKLSAYSTIPFNITFPGDAAAFNTNSFTRLMNIPVGGMQAYLTTGDIDGDGKIDMLVTYQDSAIISIYRNTSTQIQVSFAQATNIPVRRKTTTVKLEDMNGDGKPDIIASSTAINIEGAQLTIIPNTSTPGSIQFKPYTTLLTPASQPVFGIADFNSDGKPDIVTYCAGCYTGDVGTVLLDLHYFKNTSTIDSIFFQDYAQAYSQNLSNYINSRIFFGEMKIADFNNDNNPDIIVGTNANFVILFKNFAIAGFPSQSILLGMLTSGADSKYTMSVGDYNRDAYADIVTSQTIFKNLGDFNFSQTQVSGNGFATVADLNGDGLPDLVENSSYEGVIKIDKNISAGDSIAFAPSYTVAGSDTSIYRSVADLDGDGKPEILYINNKLHQVSILKNKIGAAVLCPGGSITLASGITAGSAFQWQVNSGSGFVNLSANANYSGTTSSSLQLNNIPSAWAVTNTGAWSTELPAMHMRFSFTTAGQAR